MSAVEMVQLQEQQQFGGSLDKAAGVVRNVKVLGRVSKHGYTYSDQAIRRAVGLYEGRPVNLNHTAKAGDVHDVRARFGKIHKPYVGKDGDLYAEELRYNPKHEFAATFEYAVENFPSQYGLSHVASARKKSANGQTTIESIESVISVDLVADGATTTSLFEGAMPQTTLKAVCESLAAGSKARLFFEEMGASGMGDAPMDAPAASSTPEEAIANGFKAAIHAIIDDDSMDVAAKAAKIKDLLKQMEKAMAKPDEKPADAPADAAKPAGEGATPLPAKPGEVTLAEQVAALRRENAVRKVAKAAGVELTEEQVDGFAAIPDETKAKLLIESMKGQASKAKPRSATPGASPTKESFTMPTDARDMARRLTE